MGEGAPIDPDEVADSDVRQELAALTWQGETLASAVREWLTDASAALDRHDLRLDALGIRGVDAERVSAITGAASLARVVEALRAVAESWEQPGPGRSPGGGDGRQPGR
jgi:hypothetical protein